MHAYCQWAGAALSLLLYVFITRNVLRGVLVQSFATWGLWAMLDLITVVSIMVERGNWLVLATFVVGSSAVCLSLAYKRHFGWTWFETCVAVLVGVCLLVWYCLGPKATTIAGTVSVALATLPQLKDSWLAPNRKSVKIWTGFLVINILFFLGGQSWEIKEVLYPLVCVGLDLSLMVADWRQRPA